MREKLLREMQAYAGEDYCSGQDSLLLSLVDRAVEEVVHEMHPYTFRSESDMESTKNLALTNYQSVILDIAKYHYDKQGKEGVLSYSEGGTSASYENSGTPRSYFASIVPMCKFVR